MDKLELHQWRFERAEKAKQSAAKSLDHVVFVISTGVFALTINLLALFTGPVYAPFLLICTWMLLCVSVGSHAFGYYKAVEQSQYFIDCLNGPDHREPESNDAKNICLGNAIRRANNVSYLALILGIIFLTLFASLNLAANNKQRENDRAENPSRESHRDRTSHSSWI